MKKKYQELEVDVCIIDSQDIVTASVLIQWDSEWDDGIDENGDYIFG